ncbi:hypothetical protein T11_14265 [Trichinella zimbabwensis]|uniref:Uncharacterized protein n=2 Tax=Trichinella TaxID=6333 RepID=A0A0V1MJS1_9BILA|nr:hypothetical protein T11_14265 [Trichinella zimbabwensis]KRZ71997.1 hypothetical protein T10_2175 [Trichinella papuae]
MHVYVPLFNADSWQEASAAEVFNDAAAGWENNATPVAAASGGRELLAPTNSKPGRFGSSPSSRSSHCIPSIYHHLFYNFDVHYLIDIVTPTHCLFQFF